MNVLEIKNVSKSFGSFQLMDLNLTLPGGCIMGLVGENGAGKSTTMKLILNMLKQDSGTITLFGKDNQQDLQLAKEDIGVVMDEAGIPECLTAGQVGKIMGNIFRNWDGKEYAGYLSKLSLPEDKPFKAFSRGMKMKLGIAIALSHRAKLLLLDEPTSGLDPVVRDEVVSILSEFTRDENHTVLISSHIVSDLEKLCDYIAFLHQGRLMLCEEKDVLLSRYGIIHCTRQQLEALQPGAVLHKKESSYGCEAMVLRSAVSKEIPISPISIEELFLFMVKEAR